MASAAAYQSFDHSLSPKMQNQAVVGGQYLTGVLQEHSSELGRSLLQNGSRRKVQLEISQQGSAPLLHNFSKVFRVVQTVLYSLHPLYRCLILVTISGKGLHQKVKVNNRHRRSSIDHSLCRNSFDTLGGCQDRPQLGRFRCCRWLNSMQPGSHFALGQLLSLSSAQHLFSLET